MAANSPENEGFSRDLQDLMQWIIRLTHPAPPAENEDVLNSAWRGFVIICGRYKADSDVSDLIEKGLVDGLEESPMTHSGPNDLIDEAEDFGKRRAEAWGRFLHDRAVLFAGNQVVTDYAPAGGVNRPDTRLLQKHYEHLNKPLMLVKRPSFDHTQVMTLAFWLRDRPWHRLFSAVNFHCPDVRCPKECWQRGGHRKCEERLFAILKQVCGERPLSQGSRSKLAERLKPVFGGDCEWLQSSRCERIPTVLAGTLPGVEDDETYTELADCPGLFYAGLYWFRLYRKLGRAFLDATRKHGTVSDA